LASWMVAGPSCRMFLSPGFLTRYALCRPRLIARGQVRCLRSGLRFLFLVMSAMTRARTAWACSGGKAGPTARQAMRRVRLNLTRSGSIPALVAAAQIRALSA
jgi:hypothetical protein